MLKAILAIGVLQAMAVVLNVVRAKVISVLLGPAGLGIVGTVDQLVQVVSQVSALSLPFVSIKFLSRAHSEGLEAFRRAHASFLKGVLALTFCGTTIAIALMLARPGLLGAELAPHKTLVVAALLGVPNVALGLFLTNVFAAAQRPATAAAVQAALSAAAALAAFVGIEMGGLPGIYWWGLALGSLVCAVLVAHLRHLRLPFRDPAGRITSELQRSPDIARFALMIHATGSAAALSLFAPRYLMLRGHGAEQAGLLQAVMAVALAMGGVLNAMTGQYLSPYLNQRVPEAEKLQAAGDFQRRLLLLVGPAALLLALFPEPILRQLFSDRFLPAAPWLYLFVLWQVVQLQATVHMQLLFGLDDFRGFTIVTCGGYSGAVVLCVLLIPHFGIGGAAAAFLGAATAMTLGCFAWLRLRHGFRPSPRLGLQIAYTVAAIALLGWWLGAEPLVGAAGWALRLAVLGAFATSLWLLLDTSDQEMLRGALRKATGAVTR